MSYLRDLHAVLVRCEMAPPPFDQWSAFYSDNAEMWPILDRKTAKLIGGVMFKGHTVHLAVDPMWQGRWVTKTLLRAYRAWSHDCEIHATPHKDNARAIELCRRLGLEHRGRVVGEDALVLPEHELFVKLPTMLKESPCQ